MRGLPALLLLSFFFILTGCDPAGETTPETAEAPQGPTLFTALPASTTNINFANTLTEGLNTNVLMYEYFYNGAGVAVADLNGDGLDDIYFSGNMTENKLYVNKGAMKFADVTAAAGVQGRMAPWKTGVTITDINGDSKPDIFLSYSGKVRGSNRISQLFINTGNDASGTPLFNEQAAQYGLADSSYSTQVFFFDFDRDGDLDAFFLNHNPNNLPVLDEPSTKDLLSKEDKNIGVRLLRNDDNHFVDVTRKSGMSSSPLTYGLGAGISDINQDGWPDLYLANDYSVPDYLYINNGDGTFTDRLQEYVGHTSKSSMGNNVCDVNNDGLPDIFVLDMLPEDNMRQKLLFAPDNYEKFDVNVRSGFYYQYMRNTLQLNNGDGTFSEIAQLAGISNTDWSWAPLFADYDNDGWKDLFVTNGYTRDFTNLDFLKFMNDYIASKGRLKREEILEMLRHMPASNVVNYLFRNNGDLSFTDVSSNWGVTTPTNSNGAAYADLDNDGDLDLVVNNINAPASIYRNDANSQLKDHHYLSVKLQGAGKNTMGIGAKLWLYQQGKQQFLEQMPSRGFQSTVSPVLHFGTGSLATIDSLKITWTSGKTEIRRNLSADQVLTLKEADAKTAASRMPSMRPAYQEIASPVDFANPQIKLNDFKRQPLMVNPLSFSGPCITKGDINGDGLEDVFVGGGSGVGGALFLQRSGGQFQRTTQPSLEADRLCEDADALIKDLNGDGFADLYVASGGYHNYAATDTMLQDRLYLNDGKGNFKKAMDALPAIHTSKSCVRLIYLPGDSLPDLFVGGRVIPGRYPEAPPSAVLQNDGKGHFTNVTGTICPELQQAGMVTDAAWVDLNNDRQPELVLVGEWMPIQVFGLANAKFVDQTEQYFSQRYTGWWNKLLVQDLNQDGSPELVVGNTGLNTQCRASEKQPAEMFYKDFDNNGSVDPILCLYIKGKSYPYVTRDELLDQMSNMRTRFTDYKTYAAAEMQQVFTEEEMKDAKHLAANYLQTAYFTKGKDGKFQVKALPIQAQFAPVFTINALDYDGDGAQDLLLCGNTAQARLKFGKSDANYGILLKNDGDGNFSYVPQTRSGFRLRGDVRSVVQVNDLLLIGMNQDKVRAYKPAMRNPQ